MSPATTPSPTSVAVEADRRCAQARVERRLGLELDGRGGGQPDRRCRRAWPRARRARRRSRRTRRRLLPRRPRPSMDVDGSSGAKRRPALVETTRRRRAGGDALERMVAAASRRMARPPAPAEPWATSARSITPSSGSRAPNSTKRRPEPSGRLRGNELLDGLGQPTLLVREAEVHRHSFGSARMRSPMMLRWIWRVPP